MESVEKQILTLSYKLDALCQKIEVLDQKLSQVISSCDSERKQSIQNLWENIDVENYQSSVRFNTEPELEHKDILSDGIYPEGNLDGGEKQLTPEIQIQRLTAQLTAAYNRIAALEEQLLLKRIKS
ncbi:hypothetical protein [Mastigocoleus testarum]|uniref:Uncharacterized protein n=1 Tax=Mastigocoleus testarum BC008 TaxID=371196 RepID=A0A0V7ZUL2_9CYAN|nr:hypothetical protein [Mastigocoleus testarum]KST68139.1 hypothetical protein BC008_32475 [Mastigocoleus testarum BC008]KST68802.1 hypothetical protein BC008_34160 [Mastigocoleus testarum BC008]